MLRVLLHVVVQASDDVPVGVVLVEVGLDRGRLRPSAGEHDVRDALRGDAAARERCGQARLHGGDDDAAEAAELLPRHAVLQLVIVRQLQLQVAVPRLLQVCHVLPQLLRLLLRQLLAAPLLVRLRDVRQDLVVHALRTDADVAVHRDALVAVHALGARAREVGPGRLPQHGHDQAGAADVHHHHVRAGRRLRAACEEPAADEGAEGLGHGHSGVHLVERQHDAPQHLALCERVEDRHADHHLRDGPHVARQQLLRLLLQVLRQQKGQPLHRHRALLVAYARVVRELRVRLVGLDVRGRRLQALHVDVLRAHPHVLLHAGDQPAGLPPLLRQRILTGEDVGRVARARHSEVDGGGGCGAPATRVGENFGHPSARLPQDTDRVRVAYDTPHQGGFLEHSAHGT
eukprot:Rhum_TRINITY_DN18660_c0_g1::Rhum_TRINITY_DN18660_c0_g1_i1::g.168029::m.168029